MNNEATTSGVGHEPRRRGGDSYDNIEPLFLELSKLDAEDPRRAVVRDELISRCLPLAEHIARKFTGRGENFDDLLQIARVGMVAAVDRFDASHGSPFLAFAVPTIMGEVRRHFRDRTWAVRVPRRLKEIQQLIGPATEALTNRLGRVPNAREIAAELEVELSEVTQALIARNGYQTNSIDGITRDDGENATLSVVAGLGAEEPCYELLEQSMTVRPLIAALPERERQVLIMRFFESLTQAQIAEQLGVSQMQVSRILTKTLNTLREQALDDQPAQVA